MAPKPFESRIQDLVYNVDVGIGLRLIKSGLYFLFIFMVLLIYTATQFRGFRDADAMDTAQLGRNFMKTGHLVTKTVRPAAMWFLIEKSKDGNPRIEHQPDILHPPLYPMLLGAWFKITRTSFVQEWKGRGVFAPEYHIVVLSHIFTLLTGWLVFLIARRLFERRVAILSVSLYFLSDLIWRDAISGLALSMLIFIATLAIYCAVVAITNREEGRPARTWLIPYALSILLCIAAFLTRYGSVVLVPGLMLLYGIGFRKKGWLWALILPAVFLGGITPWLARNVAVSGSPLGLAPYMALENTRLFPDETFSATLAPDFKGKEIGKALNTKWLQNVARFYDHRLNSLGDGILMCFFLVTFFYRYIRSRAHLLRWGIALSGVLLILIAGFFGDGTFRLLDMFWPVVIIYAVSFFFLLLDRLQLKARIYNGAVTAAFILLAALPLVLTLLPPRADIPYPPYYPPFIAHVSNLLKSNELMCTDMPWATAWYGNRNSLQLPVTLDEFYEINDYNKRVSGIYFTMITRNKPYIRMLKMGPYRTWFPILEGRIPSDFPLTQGFPLYNLDQIFLTDRARWEE